MIKSRFSKFLFMFVLTQVLFWVMLILIKPGTLTPIAKIVTSTLLIGLYLCSDTLLFMTLIERFKNIEKSKLLFRMFYINLLISLPIGILFANTWFSLILGFSLPLLLISFIYWIIVIFINNQLSLFKKLIAFSKGISVTLLTILSISVLIILYISKNPNKSGYVKAAYQLSSIPESINNWYFYKTGKKQIQTEYLKHNTPENDSTYLSDIHFIVKNTDKIGIPKFSLGRIAFIKDDNLWIAENNGQAEQITNDANKTISELFRATPRYRYPIWSPDGSKLVFIQNLSLGSTDYSRYFITNGTKIMGSEFLDYDRLPAYWVDNEFLLIPTVENIRTKKVTETKDSIDLEFINQNNIPSFYNGYNQADGCGGGGRPDWSYKLSYNHLGGMDGVRASLFLDSNYNAVYSTSCESEVSLKLQGGAEESKFFDNNKKPYLVTKSLQNFESNGGLPRYFGASFDYSNGPTELILSPNKKLIAGSENRDIVLYDASTNFIKYLWKSGKAYGPVFSNDSNFIYFADNFGDKPSLVKLNIDTNESKIIFTSDKVGAISNISSSPDDSQLIFTLIKQGVWDDTRSPDDWYVEATQDIYLVNSDGTNLTKFVGDASQSSWSSK